LNNAKTPIIFIGVFIGFKIVLYMTHRFTFLIIFFIATLIGCTNNKYSPQNYISSEAEIDSLTSYFLPLIIPRPDKVSLEGRFSDSLKSYYQEQKQKDSLFLHSYYIRPSDSLHYCMFIRRDRKSLYIDYRAVAATFRKQNKSITDVELKFLTPMLRKDTIDRFAPTLFNELVEKGDIKAYVDNRDYIDWPSKDVYFDKEAKKWALKPDSDWSKVMNQAKSGEEK